MTTELRVRNQAQQLYVRALSQAWRSSIQLYDPSLWLLRDPDTEEKMLRDADIAHAIGFRRSLIAGRQWTVLPRVESSPRAPIAVSVGTQLLGTIRHFTAARRNLARAFFSGARFARIHGEMRKLRIGDGRTRTWWVPVRLEDEDKRMYRIVPDRDERTNDLSAHWERWDIARSEFKPQSTFDTLHTIRHVYEDDQATLGHGRALREALGWWWYAKTHVFQESLQAVERFAQGIITARVDGARDAETGLPNSELIEAWKDVLEDLRSRHVLVYDKDDQVEHMPMNSAGWQLLSEIRQELRSTIFTLVLGANLTTAADKGGSYALAEIQENSTEALIQYDRETLEETITDDLVGCIWFKNYPNLRELGIANEMPRFSIKQEKRQDPQERIQVAQSLNQMGVNLALDDLLDQTGFRKPEQGEDVVAGGQPQMSPPGGGAFPFAFRSQYQADSNDLGPPLGFARDFDESKVKRDSGKFAPQEGEKKTDDEISSPAEPRSDSLEARADRELASIPKEGQDYLNGTAPMERQEVTDEERSDADRSVMALGDELASGMNGRGALSHFFADTADKSVKLITEPQRLLKAAVGLGIMPAASAWNVAKSYAGLVGTVLSLPGAVKQFFTAPPAENPQSFYQSIKGKLQEGLRAASDDIRKHPVSGTVNAAGSAMIAIPFPFSMDLGLAVKGIAKAGRAFNPNDTQTSIRDALRRAFMRAGYDEETIDRMIAYAKEHGVLFE